MTAEEFLGIKEYLKQALKLEYRNDLSGNRYLVLSLEGELISALLIEDTSETTQI